MLCIGVLGESLQKQTIEQMQYFSKQYAKREICFFAGKKEVEFENAYERAAKTKNALFLVPIQKKTMQYCKKKDITFSIFLCLKMDKKYDTFLGLSEGSIWIVNTDDKKINVKTSHRLITCGLNQQASVTISSFLEPMGNETKSKIQCCIQRDIPTVSGNVFEPQEFSIFLKEGEKSVSGALAAIAALMAADVEI